RHRAVAVGLAHHLRGLADHRGAHAVLCLRTAFLVDLAQLRDDLAEARRAIVFAALGLQHERREDVPPTFEIHDGGAVVTDGHVDDLAGPHAAFVEIVGLATGPSGIVFAVVGSTGERGTCESEGNTKQSAVRHGSVSGAYRWDTGTFGSRRIAGTGRPRTVTAATNRGKVRGPAHASLAHST